MPAICRVCLEECTAIINLETSCGNSLPIIHMLKEFTIKDAEAKLSKYICYECAQRLNNAYRFKRQYEESMIKFMSMNSHYVVDLTFNENCLETKPKLHLNFDQEENQLQLESAIDAIHLNFNQNIDQLQGESINHCNQLKQQMPTESTILSNCELNQNQIQEETIIHSNERHLLQTQSAVSWNDRHLLQTESAVISNERDLLQAEPAISSNDNNVECLPKLRLRIFSCGNPSQRDPGRLPMTLRSGRDLKIGNQQINFKNQKMIAIPTHQHHMRSFGCNICNRWFKTKGHLFTHKNLHNQLDIKCKNCELRFLKKPHFRGHTCVP